MILQKTKKIAVEVKDRWTAETPTHFKRIKKAGYILAGVGTCIKIMAAIFPPTMPAGLVALAPELIGIGLTVAGVSKTARVDNPTKNAIPEKGIGKWIKKLF